ncbi:MAG TPA: class I SAM-dependent methyltransferase [Phycisphaerae bacterium]|nr:class I SAM-dependent methyltransferase [Phycisphaerae bacterium]HRY67419.1 class I SAM-dependent methyltransferase [Phycisphaerae bacterium]HSA28990.1 class I SAM-dependent methyltransferase [Phycisphaerae bacterium]
MSGELTSSVVVCPDPETPVLRTRAAVLAGRLQLPLAALPVAARLLVLAVTGERLELREGGVRRSRPIFVDFVSGDVVRGHRDVGLAGRLIARAIGFKGKPQVIVDATAGLGRDSRVMASLGCMVTAVERSPVLFALLADGLDRAGSGAEAGPALRGRLRLVEGDARSVLVRLAEDQRPDVVYIDPMFPPSGKQALARKEMRICRRVVGDDPDAGGLVRVAMQAARRRVVVKRWLRVPPLREDPDIVYRGKTIRYDVYLPGLAKPGTANA